MGNLWSAEPSSTASSSACLDIGEYELTLHPILGSGSFGQVVRGKHKLTKAEVAVKIITYVQGGRRNKDLEKLALEEKERMFSLDKHDNIVEMISFLVDPTSVFLVMELCELGDLGHYLHNNSDLPDDNKLDIFHQISKAIEILHNNEPPIVHRDIKPGNVLMTKIDGKIFAKVCDFGFARLLDEGASYVNTNSAKGTTLFMAPELFEEDKRITYSTSADVFSLGLLFSVVWKYSPTNTSLLPVSVSANRDYNSMAFGKELRKAFNSASAIPLLVTVMDSDSSTTQGLKRLIQKMTMINLDRITIEDVKRAICSLLSQERRFIQSNLLEGSFKYETSITIGHILGITCVNENIWLCRESGIDVCSPDLEPLQIIRHDAIDSCRKIALLPDGDVVAVGENGAAVPFTSGVVKRIVSSDEVFKDVSVYAENVYMVTENKKIHVYNSQHWETLRVVDIPCNCRCPLGQNECTISITERHLIVACLITNVVHMLSHGGNFQLVLEPNARIANYSGPKIVNDSHWPQRFLLPALCSRGKDEALLVADGLNSRLFVLSANGDWQTVQVKGSWGRAYDAVWAHNRLYVLNGYHCEKCTIYKK